MELLFCDILFDQEFKCFVSEDYKTLNLFTNDVCVGVFNHDSDITCYFKTNFSHLRKWDDFNLEKSEYVWSIKKFMFRNVPKDYHIKSLVYKTLIEVKSLISYLDQKNNEFGCYEIGTKVDKCWIPYVEKSLLILKYNTATKNKTFQHFDEVLLWRIQMKCDKMFNKLKNMKVEETTFTFNNITISKKEVG